VALVIVSRPGDLFLLDGHRLLCADATDPASYTLLMEGKVAACSIGDPPYNVPIAGNVSGNGKVKHGDFMMGVGEWSEDEFQAFLTRYLDASAAHVRDGAAIFAFMDWRSQHLLTLAGKAAGLKHVNSCVWSKGGGAMGTPWRSAHEQILVFAKGDRIRTDNVELGRHGRNRTNVWEYAGANRPGSSAGKALALHSTPKSVEMIADAMRDVTAPGDIVLDPFLGSGTTIMAAHAVGRIGYGLELDPKYVDVIVRRWQDYTGKPAIHAASGASFAELAATRGGAEAEP
jgi:DNA modification methylase